MAKVCRNIRACHSHKLHLVKQAQQQLLYFCGKYANCKKRLIVKCSNFAVSGLPDFGEAAPAATTAPAAKSAIKIIFMSAGFFKIKFELVAKDPLKTGRFEWFS
jgi:hypothetical protein